MSTAPNTLAVRHPDRYGRQVAPRFSEGGGILICTIADPGGNVGVPAHTRNLRSTVEQSGIRCDVADPFSAGGKWRAAFALNQVMGLINPSASTMWNRHWRAAALRANLTQRLKLSRPRVLIAQCPVSAQAAMDVCESLRVEIPIALVVHFNHSEANELRARGLLSNYRAFATVINFEARVLRAVDQVIYVSEWVKRGIEDEREIEPRASTVIRNGIPETAESADHPLGRQDLGLAESDKLLINVGQLEPRNNHTGLLDLFADVAGREPRAKLLLVGDGPHRHAIEKKIAERRLADRVCLLGRRKDAPQLLALADLYVHFAPALNCPDALLDAARAGLAIVASTSGGVGEILSALEQPHLPADPASAAGMIASFLADDSRRAEAAATARKNFHRAFTAATMVDAYLQALRVGRSR